MISIKKLAATLIPMAFFSLAVIAQEKKPCTLDDPFSCTKEELAKIGAELRRLEPCRLEVHHDRFKDETLDGCMYAVRSNLYAPEDVVSLHVMAEYAGKEPSGKIRFYFWLDRFYIKASPSTAFYFGDFTDLFLIIDGKRVSLAITNYKSKRDPGYVSSYGIRSPDLVTERAEANIDANILSALSSAHSVEARWGRKELSMSSTAVERMQEFIRRYKNKTSSR